MRILLLIFCYFIVYTPTSWAANVVFRCSLMKEGNTPVCDIDLLIGRKLRFYDGSKEGMKVKYAIICYTESSGKMVGIEKLLLSPPGGSLYSDVIYNFRVKVAQGITDINLIITEHSDIVSSDTLKSKIIVKDMDGPHLSDIKLTSNTLIDEKGRASLVPNPLLLFTPQIKKLYCYTELYQAEKLNQVLILKYSLSEVRTGSVVTTYYFPIKSRVNYQFLQSFDLSKVPTGQYKMELTLLNDKKQELDHKSVIFQRELEIIQKAKRSLPEVSIQQNEVKYLQDWETKLDSVTLRKSIKAVAIVAAQHWISTINRLTAKKNVKDQRSFLVDYFTQVNKENPYAEYTLLMRKAAIADSCFRGGFGYGFESDRGRIYMKYGRPNDIIAIDDEPAAAPYEIWKFEQLNTGENNAKFIFYSPNLTSSDYVLLHSNVRFELQNPKWERELYKSVPDEIEGDNYIDGTKVQKNWYRQARALFEQ